LTLPDGPRGVGQLSFTVTVDSKNQIYETNPNGTGESNNDATVSVTTTLGTYPDLLVSSLAIDPPDSLQSGSAMVVRWRDQNSGARATKGSWNDSVVIKNLTTGEMLTTATVASSLSPCPTALGGSDRSRRPCRWTPAIASLSTLRRATRK
jgi:hypothetical protein